MTLPRRVQVALSCTPYYHCVARFVRRAFLCGEGAYTGQDFEHRKQWLLARLAAQADAFAVEICAYAIMSNHYHLVIRIDESLTKAWSDAEVIRRWTLLFKVPTLIQHCPPGKCRGPLYRALLGGSVQEPGLAGPSLPAGVYGLC